MHRSHRPLHSFLAVLIFCLLVPSIALATGFAIYTQGATPLSEAVASTAHADDPSAVFFNPALISKLPGTQIQLGTTLIIPDREFVNLSGHKTKAKSEAFFPSTLYVSHAVTDRFSVGFGIYNPFGLGTTWADNWEGRYIATKSKMTTFAFTPVAAVKVAPWITVAGGFTYLTLDATFERRVNFGPFGFSDGNQKLHGTGSGFGFNAGLLIEPTKDISLGITYLSKIHVDVEGDVNFALPNPALAALFPDTAARTSLDLPARAFAGIHFKQLYPFTFEIGTRWEGWSSFKELNVQLGQPIAGSTTSITPRDWHDTWTGLLGVRYQLNDSAALIGGYQYSGNAVPDHTFEPAIPDANSHYFSLGADIRMKSWKVGLGYGLQLLQKRTKNNSIGDPVTQDPALTANGTYRSTLHLIALSATYRF
jgi:long-chain fatty acid transport protein